MRLTTNLLPPSIPGIYFYGPSAAPMPFGNGTVCAGSPVVRVLPLQISTPAGLVNLPIDLTQAPFSVGPDLVTAGSTWSFQFWYRDPTAPPAGFNLSNAMEITFAP